MGRRRSASAGDDELYVAIRHPLGFVRVSISTATLRDIVSGARRDVLVAGLIALVGALVLALLFSRSVTRPVVELRDVARAIADGDLDRRPSISAPGEVGDLAVALHRMSEQLATRLHALEADDAFMATLLESIRTLVDTLPPETTVYPGHMGTTTLGQERATNPFLQELARG